MSNQLLWQSDVVDWEKISVDSYKFVLKQANERLSEVIEESQAIIFICIIAALSIYAFSMLFRLIYPKVFFNRGSPPKEIFFKDVFDGLTEEEGLKSVLFDEVIRIQDRIERMEKENAVRIIPYKIALRISLLFIAIALFIIIKTIYN